MQPCHQGGLGIPQCVGGLYWEEALDLWGTQKAHHQRSGAEEVPEVPTGAQWRSSTLGVPVGPESLFETNKMKVLEVLAKIQDLVQTSFPDLYDEGLRDQAERAGLRVVARAPTMAEASAPSRAKSYSSSHI